MISSKDVTVFYNEQRMAQKLCNVPLLKQRPSNHILIYFLKFLPCLSPTTILHTTYSHIVPTVKNFIPIILPLPLKLKFKLLYDGPIVGQLLI